MPSLASSHCPLIYAMEKTVVHIHHPQAGHKEPVAILTQLQAGHLMLSTKQLSRVLARAFVHKPLVIVTYHDLLYHFIDTQENTSTIIISTLILLCFPLFLTTYNKGV